MTVYGRGLKRAGLGRAVQWAVLTLPSTCVCQARVSQSPRRASTTQALIYPHKPKLGPKPKEKKILKSYYIDIRHRVSTILNPPLFGLAPAMQYNKQNGMCFGMRFLLFLGLEDQDSFLRLWKGFNSIQQWWGSRSFFGGLGHTFGAQIYAQGSRPLMGSVPS